MKVSDFSESGGPTTLGGRGGTDNDDPENGSVVCGAVEAYPPLQMSDPVV